MMQATNVTAHELPAEPNFRIGMGQGTKNKIKAKFEEYGKPPKPNSDVANFSVYESV